MFHYYIVYKPFQVLSQFSSQEEKLTLKDFFQVQKDVYPVGRLDYDSEGLLILTNDAQLNHRLLHPSFAHEREYWVQVEGDIHAKAIHQLESGVTIPVDGKPFKTRPCIAEKFSSEPNIPPRQPPIRFRKNIPTSWIRLILTEGKNRQVRKMTAKVGFPTLRLIRYRIESLLIDHMAPGDLVAMQNQEIYQKLFERST